MANIKSAKKRILVSKKKEMRNKAIKSIRQRQRQHSLLLHQRSARQLQRVSTTRIQLLERFLDLHLL